MANEISTRLWILFPSMKMTNQWVGLCKPVVDWAIDSCRFSVFMVIYGGGFIHALGFTNAMISPWKCELELFKLHALKDNVFRIIFQSAATRDRELHEGLWNFDKKLLTIQLWKPIALQPPPIFDSTYISYQISGLPSWCYTPEISRSLASLLEDHILLEICTSKEAGLGNFSESEHYYGSKSLFAGVS